MKKIVILSEQPGRANRLRALLNALFSECEVHTGLSNVYPDNFSAELDRDGVPRKQQNGEDPYIDDQACVRELISEELTDEGHSFISTGCALSALKQLRFSRPDLALVLLDLYLDDHKGWDVLGRIKKRDPHLPVLIVTAYDTFANDSRLSQADGYVIKRL